MIEIDHLSVVLGGEPVVDDVSLRVEAGEIVALVGPSGCGKTTLLRVVAGLLVPIAGIVRRGDTALMPQRDALLPWFRVLDNAVLGAQIRGVPRAQARESARQLLVRFGLGDYERAWPHELSGGMRQRVAFLRTFAAGTDTLLLDEPFGSLDALTRAELQQWLESVWLADPRTVLMVTHDIEEALLLADRVVVVSRRPARIIAVIASPFARPRTAGLVTAERFVKARSDVLAALQSA